MKPTGSMNRMAITATPMPVTSANGLPASGVSSGTTRLETQPLIL